MSQQAEATIAELAETVRRRVHSPSIEAKLAHLHDVLFDVVGFAGNVEDYYNPGEQLFAGSAAHTPRPADHARADLQMRGRRRGADGAGINSPGHFLAAVQMPEARAEPIRLPA